MTESVNSLFQAQQNLSDTLFRLWMQPLQFAQAAFAASNDLIVKACETAPAVANAKSESESGGAAEVKIAHLDEEMDCAVPGPAVVVA